MILDEFFKIMRGGKAVAYNNEDYIEMEDGKCIIKSQKDDSTIGPLFNIVVSSKSVYRQMKSNIDYMKNRSLLKPNVSI